MYPYISEKDLVDSDRNESNSTSRGLIRLLLCVFWYAVCPGFGHADTIVKSFQRTRFKWECYCTCCTYKHWKLASWRAQLVPRACVRPSSREEPPFAANSTNASISHYTISNHAFLGSSTTVLCLAASLLLVYRFGVGNPVGRQPAHVYQELLSACCNHGENENTTHCISHCSSTMGAGEYNCRARTRYTSCQLAGCHHAACRNRACAQLKNMKALPLIQ
jgi:hypothetical protein